MSDRDPALYILDICIAIDKITRYTENIESAASLQFSEITWDATIRELQIIGDAINSLLKQNLVKPELRKIVDFRNQITHAYFGIDKDIVWEVVCVKLPELQRTVSILPIKHNIPMNDALDGARLENKHNDKVLALIEKLKTLPGW